MFVPWSIRLLVILIVGVTSDDKVRYDDHKLYLIQSTQYNSDIRNEILQHIILDHKEGENGSNVTLLVEPEQVAKLEALVSSKDINNTKYDTNVQKQIDEEAKNIRRFNPEAKENLFGWSHFYDLESIYNWLDVIAANFSNIIEPITVGTSYEGRSIRGVKLSHQKDNIAIVIEAGTHSEEWVSPATATYILFELLTSKDSQVRNLSQSFDWIIFPVCNPDGYVHTFDKDRLWRKNRQPLAKTCVGVDLNANWGSYFNNQFVSKCSPNYPGPYPFSAPETKAIVEYLRKNVESQRIQAYLSLHSGSQKIQFPFAGNADFAPDKEDLEKIGFKAAEAIAKPFKKNYSVGPFSALSNLKGGTSIDYVYSELHITIVYLFDLRRSAVENDTSGYLLPAEQILEVGRETVVGVMALINESLNHGYLKKFPYYHKPQPKLEIDMPALHFLGYFYLALLIFVVILLTYLCTCLLINRTLCCIRLFQIDWWSRITRRGCNRLRGCTCCGAPTNAYLYNVSPLAEVQGTNDHEVIPLTDMHSASCPDITSRVEVHATSGSDDMPPVEVHTADDPKVMPVVEVHAANGPDVMPREESASNDSDDSDVVRVVEVHAASCPDVVFRVEVHASNDSDIVPVVDVHAASCPDVISRVEVHPARGSDYMPREEMQAAKDADVLSRSVMHATNGPDDIPHEEVL